MRQFIGYLFSMLGLLFAEIGHQLIHTAEWCFDHDGRHGCPKCIKEP